MCETQENMPARKRLTQRDRSQCLRCGGPPQHLVRQTALCQPCFLKNVHHRFTRTFHGPLIGTSKANVTTRPPLQSGDALLAMSGGAGSMALFDFLTSRGYFGVEGETYDIKQGHMMPVWSAGWAVHVVFPTPIAADQEVRARLRELAEARGMKYLELRAEDVFDEGLAERLRCGDVTRAESAECRDKLDALLASLPATSRPTMLQHILDALLALASESLPNISHLIIGETSTREAQRVITGTAQGRGWSLPLDLATSRAVPPLLQPSIREGEGRGKVVRLRAARDINVKEAAVYCHAMGLQSFNYRRWESRGRKEASSIEGLTERFIATLSTSHPATVGAITRTASKLHFTGDEEGRPCPLCRKPVDPSPAEWRARASIMALPGRRSTPVEVEDDALESSLCYACSTTLQGRKDGPLPSFMRKPASEADMRSSIAEFIIDGEV